MLRRAALSSVLRAGPRAAAPAVFASVRWCTTKPAADGIPVASAAAASGKRGDVEAEGSHPDFQPKPVESSHNQEEREAIKKDIRETIASEDVVVFMKGVPDAPVCGFSKKMVDILDALGLEYTSFDCLAHPIVRAYCKELSNWPTIPQLFVKGGFVGSCDIVQDLAANGQLQQMLDHNKIKHRNIKIPKL